MALKSFLPFWSCASVVLFAYLQTGMSEGNIGIDENGDTQEQEWKEFNRQLRGCGFVYLKPTPRTSKDYEVIFRWKPDVINWNDVPIDKFPSLNRLHINRVEILSCAVPKSMIRSLKELQNPLDEVWICSDGITDSQISEILAGFQVKCDTLSLQGRRITPDVLHAIDKKRIQHLKLNAGKEQRTQFIDFMNRPNSGASIPALFDLSDLEIAEKLGANAVGN